jgi:hypothetical protein
MKITDIDSDYQTRAVQWTRCRDAFEGADAIKARATRYLPSSDAMDGGEYTAYKERACFLPVSERTLTMLAGLAFRKDIAYKIPERLADDVKRHMRDVTLSGDDLPQVASEMLREVLNVGRFAVLLAFSTALDRPFWKTYRTEDVLRRRFMRLPSGVTTLGAVILREWRDAGEDEPREYRILHALELNGPAQRYEYVIRTYRKKKADEITNLTTPEDEYDLESTFVPLRRDVPLDRIPCVIATSHNNARETPKPPMLDIVDINIAHYRNSADREHGAFWTARPTPYITGHATTEPLRVGGERAWVLPNAESKVGMLEYTGKGLSELRDLMQDKEAYMAKLGASMLETRTRQAESAEALRLRAAESGASLVDAVIATSKALTILLWLHLWWFYGDAEPADEDVDVQINREFVEVKMDPQTLSGLVAAVQAGEISYATFYYNLERGALARPGVTAEEERQQAMADMEDRPQDDDEDGALPDTRADV